MINLIQNSLVVFTSSTNMSSSSFSAHKLYKDLFLSFNIAVSDEIFHTDKNDITNSLLRVSSSYKGIFLINIDQYWDIDLNILLNFVIEKKANAVLGLTYHSSSCKTDHFLVNPKYELTCTHLKKRENVSIEGFKAGGIAYIDKKECHRLKNVDSIDQLFLNMIESCSMKALYGIPLLGRLFNKDDLSIEIVKEWQQSKKGCLFLDRDGVLNLDKGYLGDPKDVEVIKESFVLLDWAKKHSFYTIVLTNQAGIGRGYYGNEDLMAVNKAIMSELLKSGHELDHFEFSPYHPSGGKGKYLCDSITRKPNAGMAIKASYEFPINPSQCFMIGDKESDALFLPGLNYYLIRGEYSIKCSELLTRTFDSFDEITQQLSFVEIE